MYALIKPILNEAQLSCYLCIQLCCPRGEFPARDYT